MYRKQLEKTSAMGTVGAYIYLENAEYLAYEDGRKGIRNGIIRINYVDPDCIIPLSVDDDLITECAFCGTEKVKGADKTTLVMFVKESGLYKADTIVFDELGKIVSSECSSLQLGEDIYGIFI